MTTNNQCNHALEIAKEMYMTYQKEQKEAWLVWDGLKADQRNGWLAVAEQALPIIGKHALGDVQDYLTGQAKTSTGWWKKALYAVGAVAAGAVLGGLGMSLSGCGHNVDITQGRTEVCKDGSCLVREPGHLSYSQAQPTTDTPPVVQTAKK